MSDTIFPGYYQWDLTRKTVEPDVVKMYSAQKETRYLSIKLQCFFANLELKSCSDE